MKVYKDREETENVYSLNTYTICFVYSNLITKVYMLCIAPGIVLRTDDDIFMPQTRLLVTCVYYTRPFFSTTALRPLAQTFPHSYTSTYWQLCQRCGSGQRLNAQVDVTVIGRDGNTFMEDRIAGLLSSAHYENGHRTCRPVGRLGD